MNIFRYLINFRNPRLEHLLATYVHVHLGLITLKIIYHLSFLKCIQYLLLSI